MRKTEPYIIKRLVSAFYDNPKLWASTLARVTETRHLSIPSSAQGIWHGVFGVCLDNSLSTSNVPSSVLATRLMESINKSLGITFIQEVSQLKSFILKSSCVLLRLGYLADDPKLSQLAFTSGCIKTNILKPLDTLGEEEIKNLATRVQDTRLVSGVFSDPHLLQHVKSIVTLTLPSKYKKVQPLVNAVVQKAIAIYNQMYLTVGSSEKPRKVPAEFFSMFFNKDSFKTSSFVVHTNRLIKYINSRSSINAVDSLKLSNILSSVLKNGHNKTLLKLARVYMKYINHAKTLITFYKLNNENSKVIRSIRSIVKIISTFEEISPTQNHPISEYIFDLGYTISKESGTRYENSTNNLTSLLRRL